MIALDTNVLARAIVAEADADRSTRAQQQAARALFSSGADLFVPLTEVQKLERVMRGICGLRTSPI